MSFLCHPQSGQYIDKTDRVRLVSLSAVEYGLVCLVGMACEVDRRLSRLPSRREYREESDFALIGNIGRLDHLAPLYRALEP